MKLIIRVSLTWTTKTMFWLREEMENLWLTRTGYFWTHVILQVYAAIQIWKIKSKIFIHNKWLRLLQMGDHIGTQKWHNLNYFQWRFTKIQHHYKNIYLKYAASLNGVTVTMYNSKEHEIKVLLPNGNYLISKGFNDGWYH